MPAHDRPAAFLFYPRDFIADAKVELMSLAGKGAYLMLLCKAWFETPPCTIPDDDRILAVWTRATVEEWRALRPEVLAAWSKAGKGRLIQKRLKQEYDRQAHFSKIQSDRAKKRWDPAQSGGDAVGMPRHSHGNAYPTPTPTPTPTPRKETEDPPTPHPSDSGMTVGENGQPRAVDVVRQTVEFQKFWTVYPKQSNRYGALRVWLEINPDDALVARIVEAVETQKTWAEWKKNGGEFIPKPANWLRDRRWEDRETVKRDPMRAALDQLQREGVFDREEARR